MATATIGNRPSSKVSKEEIAARKHAAAVAELERNGLKVAKHEKKRLKDAVSQAFECESQASELVQSVVDKHPGKFSGWSADRFAELGSRVVWNAAQPTKRKPKEFHSNRNAKAIPRDEIQNFEPLTRWDRLQIEDAVESATLGNWADGDARWELSPAENRKLIREKLTTRLSFRKRQAK